MSTLAIHGGTPVRTTPFSGWPVFGREEEEALLAALPQLDLDLREAAFGQLLKRADWSSAVVQALADSKLDPAVLGPGNLFRLRTHADSAVAKRAAEVIAELKTNGKLSDKLRFALSVAAFNRISNYDAAISDYLSSLLDDGTRTAFPAQSNGRFVKLQDLRYGENPHQTAAVYSVSGGPGALGDRVLNAVLRVRGHRPRPDARRRGPRRAAAGLAREARGA